VLFVALAGLAYHFIAGVKHLVMDWGVGESLEGGRTFAKISLVVSALVIAALFVGVVL
jgi:succinate dehydrogenase / fumarate reductase cytochrome b subunit